MVYFADSVIVTVMWAFAAAGARRSGTGDRAAWVPVIGPGRRGPAMAAKPKTDAGVESGSKGYSTSVVMRPAYL